MTTTAINPAGTFSSASASGLDDNTIINNLVTARSTSITVMQSQQTAYTAQISAVGDIATKVGALKTALQNLSDQGTLGLTVSGSPVGFTATPSAQAQAGSYSVQVDSLAAAAKSRSTTDFTSTTAAVSAGTLTLGIDGTPVDVTLPDGTLADAAAAINTQAPGVTASVLWDGSQAYLSVTSSSTGYSSNDTLSFSGTAAAQFGFATVNKATNAQVEVDGLKFTRPSNTFDDVIPGTSMTVSALGAAQPLVISADTSATQKNLQTFVDAYNTLMTSVQGQLNISADTDRTSTLAGDPTMRDLEQSMQSLTSTVIGTGSVRTLADLGIKTADDGTISIDSAVLSTAIGRDPAGVNAVFSAASTGLGAVGGAMCDNFTDPVSGVLTLRTQGLQTSVKQLTSEITDATDALDTYRQQLIDQYTAMESLVSGFKSVGSYLTAVNTPKTSS